MASYVLIDAIDAVIGGNEVTVPETYVALKDSTSGFDGEGSYHIQLNSSGKYVVTCTAYAGGLNGPRVPRDTGTLMTVHRVVLDYAGNLTFADKRKLNVGVAGVNATIAQTEFSDGSYLQTGVVTQRTLATSGPGAVSMPIGMGTAFPGSPTSGMPYYRTDLSALFIYNDSSWVNADSLAQLCDVSLSAPTNGQVLTYDSTSSKWKNAAAGGGGGGGTGISFGSSAAFTNYNPESQNASSAFASTATITPPSVPYMMRIRCLVNPANGSTPTYWGLLVSSDATHFVALDISNVSGGGWYGELQETTVSSQLSGVTSLGGIPSIGSAAAYYFLELMLVVSGSAIIMAGGNVNGRTFSNMLYADHTDLTVPFTVYALGAAATDVAACEYDVSMF